MSNFTPDKVLAKFQQALEFHQAGHIAEAKLAYEELLSAQPDHADAIHMLGLVAAQTNHMQHAKELLGRAIAIDPGNVACHVNYGNVLKILKEPDLALQSYEHALALGAEFAEVYYNRGIVLHELAKYEAALASYGKAISLNPNHAEAYYNRGVVFQELRQLDAALDDYNHATTLRKGYAEAWANRGVVLKELKRLEDAVASHNQAISLNPGYAEAYYNRGIALQSLSRLDAAVASYDQAISINPSHAGAYSNRGIALLSLNRLDAAMASYDQAISINPGYAEAYYNRGIALQNLNRPDAAVASYDQAISLNPGHAEAYYNRGIALQSLNRLDAAIASYDQAISLNPGYADAYLNRGNVQQDLGQWDASITSYDQAISLNPDYAEAYYGKSHSLLLSGNFEMGWKLHEWRWKCSALHATLGKRDFTQPLWLGDLPLSDKSILLYYEQGYGDVIQFCRYVKLVAGLGAQVILEVPYPLVNLFAKLEGVHQLLALGQALPHTDYQCPLMSLPLAFKTTLATIPASVPYLWADAEKQERWKQRLGNKTKPRIGLAWSGNPAQANNSNRSIPFDQLKPLLDLPMEFHVLQKDIRPDERDALSEFEHVKLHSDELGDFSDTAALAQEMDTVISVCTSIAHLAGALGKPVWIPLAYSADWRWLLDRDDSPWYPSAKLYRQTSRGDWDSVLQRVKADLLHSDL